MQHHPADQLHVEVPHVQDAPAGFADDRKGFRQQIVERGAIGDPLAELDRLFAELFVAQRLDLRFESVDGGNGRAETLDLTLILGADDLREQLANHECGPWGGQEALPIATPLGAVRRHVNICRLYTLRGRAAGRTTPQST